VSDYKLDNRVTGVRYLAEAKNFFCSLCVQISSEAHPASYPMGTIGPFPEAKLSQGMILTANAEVKNE
jgi:hypothetical protein